MKPPMLTFRQASLFGYVHPWQSRAYLDWVKQQDCACCGKPGDDPHHIQQTGKGMGTKHPDWATIPLCRTCHDDLHRKGWDASNTSQAELALWTLGQAITLGILEVKA